MGENFKACWEFLQRKFIKIQEEWLQACIEWVLEENNGIKTSSELCNLVYEQWLLSDLREIAEAAFPSRNSLTKQKEIQGKFCVQVNSVIDIGHSAYSQVQKLKGHEIDYEETEDEIENEAKEFFKKSSENAKFDSKSKKWKETTSRMLFMELHDGFQMIEAIEYQPINQLSLENIAPGCKLQLMGPMLYRDGIFLLKSCNVKYLGGNVEQLMESNSQIEILNKIIKNDQENAEKKTAVRSAIIPTTNLKKTNSNKTASNQAQQKVKVDTSSTKQKQTTRTTVETKNEEESLIPDDFIDDLDDDIIGQLDDDYNDVLLVDQTKPKNIPNICSHKTDINKVSKQMEISSYTLDEFNIQDTNDLDDDFFMTKDLDMFKENEKAATSTKKTMEENAPDFMDIPDEDSFLDEFDFNNDIDNEKLTTISDMVGQQEPLKDRFHVKGCFKTLVTGLDFTNGYKLFAILTDDVKCVKVLLGDEALTGLIGFPAWKVQQAVSNQLKRDEKASIKNSLSVAEKSLEMNKWLLDVEFSRSQNIYEVLCMKPVYI